MNAHWPRHWRLSHPIRNEFIIDNAIESILIYPHYGGTNRGWDAAMIYDISGE